MVSEYSIMSDKVIRDKAFNIAKNPKVDGYQRGFALMANFLIKRYQVLLLKLKLCWIIS